MRERLDRGLPNWTDVTPDSDATRAAEPHGLLPTALRSSDSAQLEIFDSSERTIPTDSEGAE